MKFRYVIVSFLVMGWGYYALSGGSDFVPESRLTETSAQPATQTASMIDATSLSGDLPVPSDLADTTAAEPPTDARPQIVTRAETLAPAQQPTALQSGDAEGPVNTLAEVPADEREDDTLVFTSLSGSDAGSDSGPVAIETGAQPAQDLPELDETLAQRVGPQPGGIDLRHVAGSAVNMRDGPGMGYVVIDTLAEGTETEVLQSENGWVYVRLMDGVTGWVAERLLASGGT